MFFSLLGKSIYSCQKCALSFATSGLKQRHERNHIEIRRKLQGLNDMDEEMKPYHLITNYKPFVNKSYVCEVCGVSTPEKKLYNRHIQTHEELQVACEQCDLKFPTKIHLGHHVKRQHTTLLKCHVCEKIFGSKRPFDMHMMIHNGVRPYVCETCGLSYITRGALKTHNEIVHLKCFKERPLCAFCELCGKGFINKSVMYTHINSIHLGARNFKCSICNQFYKTRSQLNEHERRHQKGSFPCKQCSLVFTCKSNLKKHMRRKKLSCPSFVPKKKSQA